MKICNCCDCVQFKGLRHDDVAVCAMGHHPRFYDWSDVGVLTANPNRFGFRRKCVDYTEKAQFPGYIIGDHWLRAAYGRVSAGENEVEVMADYGWAREGEVQRLERENRILRHELKEMLVSEWAAIYDMSEERAKENAEQYIVHAIAHNEGAE